MIFFMGSTGQISPGAYALQIRGSHHPGFQPIDQRNGVQKTSGLVIARGQQCTARKNKRDEPELREVGALLEESPRGRTPESLCNPIGISVFLRDLMEGKSHSFLRI